MDHNYLFFGLMPLLYFICCLTFALFAYDKHLAVFGRWRIPEWLLLCCSFFAGAFGGLCAMVLFNHKTQKAAFYVTVPVLLFVQILLLAFALTR